MEYVAEIKLSPKLKSVEKITVNVGKDIENTSYDDVLFAVQDRMDIEYPESDFPSAEVFRLFVRDGGELFPVVSETDKKLMSKYGKSKEYEKFLVLPWAQYSLTPECELWMELKESGIIDEDTSFDYDTYHKLVKKMGIERNKSDGKAEKAEKRKKVVKNSRGRNR